MPLHHRAKIAEQFNIKKVRPTHVANNVVIDDGYSLYDVERAVDTASLQVFLKTHELDPIKLFDLLGKWANGEYEIPVLGDPISFDELLNIPEEVLLKTDELLRKNKNDKIKGATRKGNGK
jgi:hypothetical protein